MSYDIYLEIDTGGPEPVAVFDWNFTSNVAPMWRAAGADLAEFHGKQANECDQVLTEAIIEMETNSARYEAMDSPNGWGTYEHLMPRLRVLLRAFRRHPKTTIRVSR